MQGLYAPRGRQSHFRMVTDLVFLCVWGDAVLVMLMPCLLCTCMSPPPPTQSARPT